MLYVNVVYDIMFDQLEMLDTTRTNWRVKVRITRMWSSVMGNGNNTVTGHNAILLDDDVSLILIALNMFV